MNEHPALALIIIGLIVIIDFFTAHAKSVFEHVNTNKLSDDGDEAEEEKKLYEEYVEYHDKHERSFFNACWLVRGVSWTAIGGLYAVYVIKMLNSAFSGLNRILAIGLIVLITIASVFIIVMMTYILPDRLGNRNTEDKFVRMFGLIKFINNLFYPLSTCLEFATSLVLKPFGIKLKDLEENVTEEEIISIVNEGQEQGVLDDDEAEMISNIITFDEKQAKDIMTHRTKVVAVDASMTVDEALQFMSGEAFSRYPLYEGDIDNIVGFIHLKDVAKALTEDNKQNITLRSISRKPFFVPDTISIDELFSQMQNKKCHMAVIIDEYGQTAGIVAMEDILEEIVGNIEDEFDTGEKMEIRTKDGSYILRGEAGLEEVSEVTGIEIREEDMENYDTVNGLIISLLDRIPNDGDRDIVTYENYRIEILEVKNKMVRKCRISKIGK